MKEIDAACQQSNASECAPVNFRQMIMIANVCVWCVVRMRDKLLLQRIPHISSTNDTRIVCVKGEKTIHMYALCAEEDYLLFVYFR